MSAEFLERERKKHQLHYKRFETGHELQDDCIRAPVTRFSRTNRLTTPPLPAFLSISDLPVDRMMATGRAIGGGGGGGSMVLG